MFSSKCSYGLHEQKFGCLAAFFAENLKLFFCSNSQIFSKTFLCSSLFERISLSKLSSALKESYFEKTSKKSLQKSELDKTGPRTSGIVMKFNPWIGNFQFREGSQKFFGQRPSVCRSKNEKDERTFFWTTLFSSKCSNGLHEQKFGCLAAFFAENLKLFFALTPKFFQKHFFVRKNFSVETILSAWRKQSR